MICLALNSFSQVEKKEYYKAFKGERETEMDAVLKKLEATKETSLVLAYRGALLAKKSSLQQSTKEKLSLFKQGRKLLENEILYHPANVEYRFLRLAVQEHCPKILHYSGQLDEDKKIIEDGFSKQEKVLQDIILDYASQSEVLSVEHLKR